MGAVWRGVTADPPLATIRIITRNPETALSLRSYFWEHDVEATIEDSFDGSDVGGRVPAILVFPDEFPELHALNGVARLLRNARKAIVIVVTREMARFDPLVAEHRSRRSTRLLILPRPVWGWTLLEQIQRSLQSPVDPSLD